MSMWKNIKSWFVEPLPDEAIPAQFVEKPKDYPDGLPKNHTEHIDSVGVQPGSKV